MINKITVNEALEKIPLETPSGIKASCVLKCYPETPVFSDGEAVVILFGERAFLFGEPLDEDELLVFLRFNSVKSVEGGIISGEKRTFSVMESKGGNREAEQVKIEPVARLIAKTFSVDFEELYSDLCRRVNNNVGAVFGDSVSAAALHKVENINLLWGVSVTESERGKEKGSKIVEKALNCASVRVLAVCEEALEPFYQKCGFKKTGSVFEINIEEIEN